jgi:phage repressor protein C with HTH and peptisase S24 domain
MPDDNMEPEIRKGDRLGLWAYPDGKANPIPGKIYAVETYSNGFIVRYLFITPDGDYLMRSQNPELFPDFIVRKDDVMRVYKKLIMVRI